VSLPLHADALAVLSSWGAPTLAQAALRDRFVEHLLAHPDGLSRECHPDHLTTGMLVLSASLDEVLLNLHGKAQRWFHFGGHCEPADLTLVGAARRETLEESGLASVGFDPAPVHLDLHEVPFCGDRGAVRHLDVRFAARADGSAEHAVSDESSDVRWWPIGALPELEPEMHTLIRLSRERLS
jgi:8-oxo-dGTP pyrophosphatase MutT (NUDIX family)